MDRYREQIILQENVTDKLIQANPLLNKSPKIERLVNFFEKLFKKDEIF